MYLIIHKGTQMQYVIFNGSEQSLKKKKIVS